MMFRAGKVTALTNALVLAFPILLLCVPKGAGIFLGAILLLALIVRRGLRPMFAQYRATLYPIGLAILALVLVFLGSKLYFHVPWNVMDNPSRILLLLVTCLVILKIAPDPRRLWSGITIALAMSLAIVLFQRWVLDDPRPSAWTQAIAFGNMVAALGLIGFVRPGISRKAHLLAWLDLALAGSVLIVNGTRGAWLALCITMIPLLFVRYPSMRPAKFFGAVALIAALAAGLYLAPGSPVAQRVDLVRGQWGQFQQGNTETSVGARLKLWQMAAESIHLHPWLGVGVGQFARIPQASIFCKEHGSSDVCTLEHAHNDVLEAAATMGMPGMLALLGLFLVPGVLFWRLLRVCWRNANSLGISVCASGIGVVMASLISGLTQVTMAHQANIVFYAGIIGLLLGLAAVQAKYPRADGVEKT
ncbi:O-antigen ligase family protein [Cupriavidus basilensis]|uniref:Lipid A core-O-antigen ligase-related enzymes n=1 Tax=Cupriavidus basilensis TaxID=68895 RepID=A0A0C4YCI0_9BURK|nr:O-antigen ligase family protein [Cupriavidus basilensis]AJG18376.1 Lipid A core - O-antigen ligase-related enzymes [Cupriavidus basilensis]